VFYSLVWGSLRLAPIMKKVILSFLTIVGCTAAIPEDWIQLGKAEPDYELVLTFAIERTDPGWLDEKLRAVSYPDSPEYGKYMNFDEIAKYVHGRPESVQAVVDALVSVGVGREKIDFTLGLDFAVVTIPVTAAETLFAAEFYEFQHSKETDRIIARCLSYTVPKSLAEHLEFIFGLVEFPATNVKVLANTCLPQPFDEVNPSVVNNVYNLKNYVSTSSNNSQAIAGFGSQYFSPKDLATFQNMHNISSNPITKTVGNNDASDPALEGDLDVEYITSVGQNVSTWYFARQDYDFLQWIIDVVNTTDAPWVHSASYFGLKDSEDYKNRCEDEFKKFGISGRTLLFASGDFGVNCTKQKFVPLWSTSSISVTSVGGTLQNNNEAWICGGGGFSDVFPMPPYQKTAVEAYLNSGKAPSTMYFNSTGRAYPDVSAFALYFNGTVNGKNGFYYGTSFATPTVAGVVSCLNDIRLNKGEPTLGFLNPLLYEKLYKGFHDITVGENSGPSTCPGFKAIQGWDPATGWGSPNFAILKTLV